MKTLHILTGPTGAGKTTYAAATWPDLPVFDTDLGNKPHWRYEQGDAVLMTAAPSSPKKDYWVAQAAKFKFMGKLYVCDPGRMEAARRVRARAPNAAPKLLAVMTKSVQRWYSAYSRHPKETRVCPPSI